MVLSNENRLAVLERAGWSFFDYSGKIQDAPRQIRHLVRELQKGTYTVNLKINRVVSTPLPKNPQEKAVIAYVQAFKDTFNLSGWKFFEKLIRDNTTAYVHFDAQPYSDTAKNCERLTINRDNGYFASRGDVVVGPYTYPVDLTDALVETQLSPLVDGLTEQQSVAGQWLFTEFPNHQGGLITDGPVEQGVVMAYLPQHANSTEFGRLAVVAPDMFKLIYEMASHAVATSNDVALWQGQARLLVGHVNS
jgi:hypothetical protein